MDLDTIEQVILYLSAAVLATAMILSMVRVTFGPNSIDRVMSLDTISAIAQCGVALYIAWTLDTTPIAMTLALALIGFLGSVSVARFRVPDSQFVPGNSVMSVEDFSAVQIPSAPGSDETAAAVGADGVEDAAVERARDAADTGAREASAKESDRRSGDDR
ncbi:monovalent cation/H+ antiporter complex subunit F [Dietzia sp.]|uniref:monovalent cation/H+ antiporter complex subunit F n=1 Tax=Dietzia sp. TaxID=1871616 RepID=UPI002FD9C98B